VLSSLNEELARGKHLADEQIRVAVAQLVDESVPAALKADFLCHLARKVETPDEIAAFARELPPGVKLAIAPEIEAGVRDLAALSRVSRYLISGTSILKPLESAARNVNPAAKP